MATQGTHPGNVHLPAETPTRSTVERGERGILERRRELNAERKRKRLVGARSRRRHARWLRGIANCANDPSPVRRHIEVLLHYRAAAVRTDLLELAAMLERAHEPDPACMAALHELLSDGRDSALYNPNIPVDELHATIEHVRAGLTSHPRGATRHHSAPSARAPLTLDADDWRS